MFLFRNRTVSIMVLCAVVIHLTMAFALWFDDSAVGATAVHALHRFIATPKILSVTFASVAMLALTGVFTKGPWVWTLLIPQQVVLTLSADGAFDAIWLGHFADGTIRPWGFILADQVPALAIAAAHTVAILAHYMRVVR